MLFVKSLALFAAAALAAPASNYTTSTSSDEPLPAVVVANPRANNQTFIRELLLASTGRERANLYTQPGDVIFDFNKPPANAVAMGRGGRIVSTRRDTFPGGVIGNGGSVSIGFLDACGLNSPHVHNRATEFNLVVQGRLVTSFVQENGVAAREDLLTQYQMAVFPQGAIHAEYNPDCTPAVFSASFPSEDPGVEQVAQAFFNLRPDIVAASLNGVTTLAGEDIESFRAFIPDNVVRGVESCLKRCKIPKKAKRDIAELLV